jgi:hypothetical protein
MLEQFNMSDCHPVTTPMLPGLNLAKESSVTSAEEAQKYHSIYLSAVGSCYNYAFPVTAVASYPTFLLCPASSIDAQPLGFSQ